MNINYNRLFNITLQHNYYNDNYARGVHLIAGDSTERLIKNGRMLLKTTPRETVVLYKASEDGESPFIEMDRDQKFIFGIRPDNPGEFLNITDLDENSTKKFESSNIVYFKNDPGNASSDVSNPEEIMHEIIDSTRSQLFTYNFFLDTNPSEVHMEISDESGNLVSVGKNVDGSPFSTTLTVTIDADGVYSQQVDMRENSPGKYTITIRDAGDTTILKEETIFADDYFITQKIIGIVEIVYDTTSNHLFGGTEQYALKFSRRQTKWKYFIVDKNKQVDIADILSIIDGSTGVADPYEQNTFTMEGDHPHTDVRINDLDTIIFKSNELIPFFEIPKLNLELKNSNGVRILPHLPNPSHGGVVKDDAGTSQSEIYVFI